VTKFPWLIAQHLHGNAVALQRRKGEFEGVAGRAKGWKRERDGRRPRWFTMPWIKREQSVSRTMPRVLRISELFSRNWKYFTMRWRHGVTYDRAHPICSGEAYPSRSDTFLVTRFRSCMFSIAYVVFCQLPCMRNNFIIILCIVNEVYCICWYSVSIFFEILPEISLDIHYSIIEK